MAGQTMAFGVEPGFAPYRLRLARYAALGETVADFVRCRTAVDGRSIELLDVGAGDGRSRRYIEVHPDTDGIRYHGVDRFRRGHDQVYKCQSWKLHTADLENGLSFLPSNHFDVVICEQVLEHLHHAELAAAELFRVLKPYGMLVAGVPIFPHGIHALRKFAVTVVDRWLGMKKTRSHCRAFSLRSFKNLLRTAASQGPDSLEFTDARGFRVISGGPLRPLEHFRWWWQVNSLLGQWIPSLCIEVQVVATKIPSFSVPLAPAAMRKAA